MNDPIAQAGAASLFIVVSLIQTLVHRGLLSLSDAKEMLDLALLNAEERLGNKPQLSIVRSLIASFLTDVEEARQKKPS